MTHLVSNEVMALLAAALLGLVASAFGQAAWPTLRQELQKHKVDAAHLDDADHQITSFAVDVDDHSFVIAYYWADNSSMLPTELRLRSLDRRTGIWRQKVFDADALRVGSVMNVARRGNWIYIDTHLTPSAGALLIVSKDLRRSRRVYGWTGLLLPDGRLVYHKSMVHFAPFHPGSVSLYDPNTDRDVRLYPVKPDPQGPVWKDRAILSVTAAGDGRIRIKAEEQDVTLTRDSRSQPKGPKRTLDVICHLATRTPICR